MLLFLLGSSMISCVNALLEEDAGNGGVAPSTTPISITASNLHQQIYSSDVESGFGLYVLLGENTLEKSRYVSNAYFKSDIDGFHSVGQIYFPSGSTKVSFVGYYPFSENGVKEGEQQIGVSVQADQSKADAYNASDFMVARASNIASSFKSIPLSYVHQFSQLSIQLKCASNVDVANLALLNPKVVVTNTFTNAQYQFNTNSFSEYSSQLSITPYGKWSVDGSRMEGKTCVVIPQTIPAKTVIALLIVGDRSYECRLADNYVLEGGKTHVLTLSYDPSLGISNVQASINDWIEGGSSDIIAVDKEEKDYISINELDFSISNVFAISSKGVLIAEICKELLRNEQLDKEAVVVYLAKNGVINRTCGAVWQLLDEQEDKYRGEVVWEKQTDTFTYTSTSLPKTNDIFFDLDTLLVFDKPKASLMVSVKEDVLVDYRGGETITYPIVKIGSAYWLRDDLRATRYTTGKSITKKTTQNYSKTTAGYFKVDSFVFYNKAALLTGNIAPIGWRVSNKMDWDKLSNYVGGYSSYIKKSKEWLDLFCDANNTTSFSAVPSGFFGQAAGEEVSTYGFANKSVAYWQMDNNGEGLFNFAVLLKYDIDSFNNASYSDYSGYSVRCVRE